MCPTDLAPELEQLQRNCIDDLVRTACNWENPSGSAALDTNIMHLFAALNRIHRKSGSEERSFPTKIPLSPKTSDSLSVSTLPSTTAPPPSLLNQPAATSEAPTIGPIKELFSQQLRRLRHHREGLLI
ncbi:unnamed protein product [Gongylonema pulchrum]|uniref:Uncharacterized protein n=1 Tax=Gongylonema pulchrum TaxID=637853 RepID=A0A183CZK8_9BILA|nr:unnamed protein product [Gongylonema pulchrum]